MHGNYKVASQVFDIPSGSKQRKFAVFLAILIVAVSMAAIPLGLRNSPGLELFFAAAIAWLIFGDLLTAFIAYSQYRASGIPSLLVLSCTYLFTGIITAAHIITFPGLFSDAWYFGERSQAAGWLWVFWHSGFSLGILLYVLTQSIWPKPIGKKEHIFNWGVAGISFTLLLALGFIDLSILGERALPEIIRYSDYRQLNSTGLGPAVWLLNLAALLVMALRNKGHTVLHLWLTVAIIGLLMDVTLTLLAGTRFSLGWYMAKINSVVAATVVICSVVNEVNRLFIRLSEQHRQLVASGIELEKANEKLTRLTQLDGLTGIPNRRRFDEILSREMVSPGDRSTPLSLLIIDVDCFKAYNDHYGHQGGDEVLRSIAQAIHKRVQAIGGFAARYGGEEFVVILPDCGAGEARSIAERLRRAVSGLAIPHEVSAVSGSVTISIGGCCIQPFDPVGGQELIGSADRSLYKAKEAGRNRSVVEGWTDSQPTEL